MSRNKPVAGSLRDAQGSPHAAFDLRFGPPRIVSLVPSITELLCDLGLAPYLVGRTGFCVHPAETVKAIKKVGGTKTVNIDKIRKLAATYCIVNIDENEQPTVTKIATFVRHVIVTHPQTPRDNLTLFRLLGHVFRADERAAVLSARFTAALATLNAKKHAPTPLRVLYLIWKDPWMTVTRETYIATMLELIDWRQIDVAPYATGGSSRYPAIALEGAVRDADVILLSSEPYAFTSAHVAELSARFPDKRVMLVDGEMLSWYGSRAIAGLEYLRVLAETSPHNT